jgi:hypothetical protein
MTAERVGPRAGYASLATAEKNLSDLATLGPKAGRAEYGGFMSSADAVTLRGEIAALRTAITAACLIIETGDNRLLASDGPAGGQPPDLSLAEWRKLYLILDRARSASEATV